MSDTGADAAQRYREHMREKAVRLGGGEDAKNVDASDFTPAEKLYAGVKTGMRPVSRQARKSGGKVEGAHAAGHPGRSPRKGGGFANAYVNRDEKSANAEREGEYPNGGMKTGGRAGRAEGGYLPNTGGPSPARALRQKSASGTVSTEERPASEDRRGRASGGRAHRDAGGPLSTPLSAGIGGQGRMNFNYPANRAQMIGLKTGGKAGHFDGRAKAQARYGRADGGSVENEAAPPGAAPTQGRRVSIPKSARAEAAGEAVGRAIDKTRADYRKLLKATGGGTNGATGGATHGAAPPKPYSKDEDAAFMKEAASHKKPGDIGRKKGGSVETKVLAAHEAEHEAMAKPKHGKECDCSRCTARKAKGGLLRDWDAKQRARGGEAFRTKSGDVSEAGREKAEAKGETMPGGGFPIRNRADLKNAKQSVGRAKDPAAARRWIDKRAKQLDEPGLGEAKGRARGGRSGRGKMNVNIVIAPGGGGSGSPPAGAGPVPPPGAGPMRPPGMPVPMPPQAGPAAPPPAAMPVPVPMAAGAPPGGGGLPTMPMRKRGGRIPAGAGSGLGRLQKISDYGTEPAKAKTGV